MSEQLAVAVFAGFLLGFFVGVVPTTLILTKQIVRHDRRAEILIERNRSLRRRLGEKSRKELG